MTTEPWFIIGGIAKQNYDQEQSSWVVVVHFKKILNFRILFFKSINDA